MSWPVNPFKYLEKKKSIIFLFLFFPFLFTCLFIIVIVLTHHIIYLSHLYSPLNTLSITRLQPNIIQNITQQPAYNSLTCMTHLKIWVKRVVFGLTRIYVGRVRAEIFDTNNNMGRVWVAHFNPPTRKPANPSTRHDWHP